MFTLAYTEVINKGVKNCPHCGNKAYFHHETSLSYRVTCSVCGCAGPEVEVPTYWSKGERRLLSRMFQRAVKPWNYRGKIIKVEGELRRNDGL